MDTDLGQIIFMVICVILSGYFSATETAFSSINKARIKSLQDKGNKNAAKVLKLTEEYDKLLSTILIGNNIVNIALSSVGTVMFVRYLGDKGATVSTIVITVVVLIFGEITPKSLAKDFPEKFAMFSAKFIHMLIILLTPLNFLFSAWKKLINTIVKPGDDRKMTDDELLNIVEEATGDGGIDEQEGELLKSVIEFSDHEAQDVLTPRVDVEAVQITASMEEVEKVFIESGYSRLPVYGESIDRIIGIIHQKDFYAALRNGAKNIRSAMNKPVFTPPNMKIDDLLTLLQKTKSHMAVVTDEYGGTMGIVTMEDILEELVGEIWDEHDEVIEEFTKTGENEYKVVCSADLDDMFEYFGLTGEYDSTTVSGWVLEQLERIPSEGDSFDYENLTVTVTSTDSQRVLEIKVTVHPERNKENGGEKGGADDKEHPEEK